jgi:hypothetical protein
VEVQEPPQEAEHEQQVLGPGGTRPGERLGLLKPDEQIADVVADRGDALPGGFLPHQVGDQQAEQQLALDGGEAHRGPGPRAKRLQALVGQCIDGARAGLTRLGACRQVSELGEPFGLDVVLALTCPVENPPVPRHPEEIVRAGPVRPDEAEDLVGEQAQFPVDIGVIHSFKLSSIVLRNGEERP